MSERKVLLGVLFLSALLIIGSVFFLSRETSGNKNDINYSSGQKTGKDDAKYTLVEFSDFQCPACKAYEPAIQKIRSNPNVRYYYRHFPLAQHQNAKKAALAAEEASSQNKFWEFHDKLFETQEDWGELEDPFEYFAKLGDSLGLDGEKIKASQNNDYLAKVDKDIQEGLKLGVRGTPTFYLNGVLMNFRTPDDLLKAVEQ